VIDSRWSERERRWAAAAVVAVVALAGAVACGGTDQQGSGAPPATADPAPGTTSGTATPGGPAGTKPAPPEPPRPAVVAHRGASGYAPEHTFAAYDLALEQGADYLEQDLQMTADGVLVVLHDDVLDRVARGPVESCTGPVADKTLAQLGQCDVGTWFNEAYPDRADPAYVGLRIPTMEEVLETYGPDVRYYIEIKSPDDTLGMEAALLDLLDEAGLGQRSDGSVLIQSFSADSLKVLHGTRPDLPLVQLLTASAQPIAPSALDDIATYATGVGPSKANVDAAFVEEAHRRCLLIHPYTVDDPSEMAALVALGVDGMFTNRPDELLTVRAEAEADAAPSPSSSCEPSP
jgi:glycerophosphoryl diester phosphodiesterase